MAAQKQSHDEGDDTKTNSLMESIREVQTSMSELYSTVNELTKSMSDMLKSLTEMKEAALLQPTALAQVTVDLNLPETPEKQPIAVDNSVNEKEKGESRYICVKKIQIELPVFEGLNVNLWILRAERYFKIGNFTDPEKLDLAYLSVDGAALSWYTLWNRLEPFVDWEDFKSRLLDRFGGLKPEDAFRRLLNLKQDESVTDYLGQFEELASLLTDTTREFVFENLFVNGLNDEIKEMLRLYRPKGIDDIIEMARRLENSAVCRLIKSHSQPLDDSSPANDDQCH